MPYFTFQESRIWDGAKRVDPNGKRVTVKAKTDIKARKKLPTPSSIGREWIRVEHNLPGHRSATG
jgi:hypothetical protein